jgi:hypothetical protein
MPIVLNLFTPARAVPMAETAQLGDLLLPARTCRQRCARHGHRGSAWQVSNAADHGGPRLLEPERQVRQNIVLLPRHGEFLRLTLDASAQTAGVQPLPSRGVLFPYWSRPTQNVAAHRRPCWNGSINSRPKACSLDIKSHATGTNCIGDDLCRTRHQYSGLRRRARWTDLI